jgi:MYXO-CTERM domain-containing protein
MSLISSETEDINATLSGQPYTTGVLSATFDVKFTALPTTGGSYFAHFKNTTTSNFRADLTSFTTGAGSGFFRLGISNDGGVTVPVAVDLSLNTVYTVVMTWDLATNRSSLSVNGGTVVTDTDAASSISVASFAFRQNSGIGTLTVDNLVVTAVPETSAAVLGSLGLLGLLRRRRSN